MSWLLAPLTIVEEIPLLEAPPTTVASPALTIACNVALDTATWVWTMPLATTVAELMPPLPPPLVDTPRPSALSAPTLTLGCTAVAPRPHCFRRREQQSSSAPRSSGQDCR